jgi:uncharacterized protein
MREPALRITPTAGIQIRATDGEPAGITAHAAVFNTLSEDLGGWREILAPGCFASALARGDDVRALENHEHYPPLGSTRAGTLKLWEDETGLAFDLTPPKFAAGRLFEMIDRRDLRGMSFGFFPAREEWDETTNPPTCRVLEVERLVEISFATFPAYRAAGADLALRSLEQWRAAHPKGRPNRDLALAARWPWLSGR